MMSSAFTLVRGILVVLLVLSAPAAAHSQQSQELSQPGEKPSQEKAPETQTQKPDETNKPEQQQGTVIVPKAGEKAAPEQTRETEAEPAFSRESGGTYIIKQGDTLWDISNMFLKDPFLWPFIWKANPYIANPDLIYPGNRLAIPGIGPVERAMQAPAEPASTNEQEMPGAAVLARKQPLQTAPTVTDEERGPVNRFILPDETPVPIIDKYSMLNAGFVSQEESEDRIVGSLEGKTIFGYDDIVYVTINSKQDAAVGDKLIMYRPLERVKHPVTGRNYGRLIKVLGILQLMAKGSGNNYTARITLSFDAADKKSMLTPYQEPTLIYNSSEPKAKDVSGYILEVVDGRTINAQIDIVYLDKGSADGVEPGDRFLVYSRSGKETYPRNLIGEAQVFLVKERTATAVVRKSTDTLAKGDPIESKTGVPEDSGLSSPAMSPKKSTKAERRDFIPLP